MFQLTMLIRSLGNPGAVANVRTVLDARRREDWVVRVLSEHLADAASSARTATTAPAPATQAA